MQRFARRWGRLYRDDREAVRMSGENWQRQLQYQPPMSKRQFDVLARLLEAKQADALWIELDDIDPRTTRKLMEEDLIFKSEHETGTRYKITFRGEKVYKAYAAPNYRTDGLCPNCEREPVHYYSTGRRAGYCKACLRAQSRRRYQLRIYGVPEGRMCSRCHKRPVHVQSSGRVITYCLHCKNVRSRREKKRLHKKRLKLIQAGMVLLCTRPGCTRPRHVTANCVNDLCREHYREWHNDYRHRKRAVTPVKKPGRPRKSLSIEGV